TAKTSNGAMWDSRSLTGPPPCRQRVLLARAVSALLSAFASVRPLSAFPSFRLSVLPSYFLPDALPRRRARLRRRPAPGHGVRGAGGDHRHPRPRDRLGLRDRPAVRRRRGPGGGRGGLAARALPRTCPPGGCRRPAAGRSV